ncbi:hypothetical protein D1007_17473 [Hordeum vulgare]|nr:hypothetical protein D1007_17473 [Hordeum vulgare]
MEHGCLEALQRKVVEARYADTKQVSVANAKLASRKEEIRVGADAKTAADHPALSSLELRADQAMSCLYRLGLESPFVPQDVGYAEVSFNLVKELEGAADKVDSILEEYRNLFSVVVTRVFIHLLLREPHFEFGEPFAIPIMDVAATISALVVALSPAGLVLSEIAAALMDIVSVFMADAATLEPDWVTEVAFMMRIHVPIFHRRRLNSTVVLWSKCDYVVDAPTVDSGR